MGFFSVLFWFLGIEINKLPWRFEFFVYRGDIREVENRRTIHRLCRKRILSPICLLFSLLWSCFLWIEAKLGNFAFCLLFSIASFSTLGAKYIKPKGNASRWLSAVESLLGAFFIALFIYVFARKMLR
jgi:Na+/H+ antiporter NhaD/arsenite permease-like protein